MGTRERPADRGRRVCRTSLGRVAKDFRDARVGAGLSLRFVAEAVGSTHGRVGRFERGELRSVDTAFLGACCAAVGLDLALRTYPVGDPLRDRAHASLLGRLHRQVHRSLEWRTEVPILPERDLRAWDAEIRGPRWRIRVEAETRIDDGQSLERRFALKVRDGGPGHVMLLVSETRANRVALLTVGAAMRHMLPWDSRSILAALREGREPPGNGIVVL